MLIAHFILFFTTLGILTAYASNFPEVFDMTDEVMVLIAVTLCGYSFYVLLLFIYGVLV